jgi:hypothetical protein
MEPRLSRRPPERHRPRETAISVDTTRHMFSTSRETHYVTATKPNRLMLFRETVAVYCENHMEHTDTLCGQNAEFECVKAGGTYSDHPSKG